MLVPALALALLLPSSTLAQEVIVDDQDGSPAFTTTGDDWTTWGTNGYGYDGGDTSYHYLSHTLGGDDRRGTATWSPTLSTAGTWRVETWFRRTENRTSDADHYVTDGLGSTSWQVIDQTGEGSSGWLSLGEYYCEAGFGGGTVTLDGTDDDGSDEANAMRFVLVEGGDPPETDPCDEDPGPGSHTMELYATTASGSGWSDTGNATGSSNGAEAHSENVDDGEILMAGGWAACDPEGEESIDTVELAVEARTQYESGTYALDLRLDANGDSWSSFTGTSSSWHSLDVSSDHSTWDWATVAALQARLSLHDHPGGARDSDAWVDAFRLRVGYTVSGSDPPPDDSGTGPDDPDTGSGAQPDDTAGDPDGHDSGRRDPPGDLVPNAPTGDGCSCAASPAMTAPLLLLLLVGTSRRGRAADPPSR